MENTEKELVYLGYSSWLYSYSTLREGVEEVEKAMMKAEEEGGWRAKFRKSDGK